MSHGRCLHRFVVAPQRATNDVLRSGTDSKKNIPVNGGRMVADSGETMFGG
jgi:hypothetical protein